MGTLLNEFQQTVTDNPFVGGIGITPTQRQALFLTYPAKEILYGGAAGGGKSAALLIAALQYVIYAGYDALLLRRTFADLAKPRALIPLSMEWLSGTAAKWDSQLHQWKFPSGATLSFGYLETEKDKFQYQSAAYQFIGFDELTQFTESQYRYMFSRCRRLLGSPVPSRVRSASNPGGEGHEWVKKRFLDTDRDGRKFISARMDENPYLDREDYEAQLAELDLVTREQLKHGDWNVRPEGNMFKREWFADNIVDRAPAGLQWVRYWDLASGKKKKATGEPDWVAGCLLGADNAMSRVYVADMQRIRKGSLEIENKLIETAKIDGRETSVRIEQEPGGGSSLYIDHMARVLKAFDVRGIPSTTDKVTRAKPASAAAERGDVMLVRGSWISEFLDELCAFPAVANDDQVDAFTGGYNDVVSEPEPWADDDAEEVLDYGSAN